MSELTEYLAHKYNNMSKESKSETGLTYNPAYLGGYRQCMVDAQGYKPTLNENQQIVLEWLKKEYAERNLFPTEVAWLLFESVDNGYFEPEEERAFENLNKLQEAQVLQAFASWVEQEEE